MNQQATIIWNTLELRTPAMLACVDRLSEEEFLWQPPHGANSASWLLWHIAEVEDNWIRDKVYDQPRRYPFGVSVRDALTSVYPDKETVLRYFHEVRALSRGRLERTTDEEFERPVDDETFGHVTVRHIWIGVATSCAWHGGQLVLIANRLIPR